MPATLLACAVLPLLLVGSVHCAAHQLQEAQAAVAGGTPEPTAVPVAAVAIPAVNASAAAALPGPPELPSTAPMLGPGSASAEPRAESKVEPMAMTTVPPSPPVVEAQEVPDQPTCVHLDEALCPPAGELCRCKVINRTTTVLCCGITRQLQLRESLNCQGLEGANITGLHARNITLASLDVSFLNLTRLHLPHLESLAITDGHISDLHGHLDAKNLACLNLSSNNMVSLSEETFSSLHSLENLDLSGNDLKHIVNFKTDVPELKLDISGNNNVSCPSIMELMKSVQTLNFSHDKNSTCLSPASFSWFNSTAKVPLSSLSLLSKLEQECPQDGTEPCYCTNFRLDIVAGKQPTFSVGVDCSNRRLTSLPPKLPTNTISLNVSSNNISDLSALSMNKAYADIRYFYADDNQITSITALEGSTFINSFVFLSLRNNNISLLPTYILSNVFDRNSYDSRTVLLGRNRLKCDCTTAQQIKMWLNANYKHIPDYNEVLCENMRERVFELDQNKVCTVQSDWTEYVYYLVAAEVLLLILLISKVSYDYWVFKTAGYLPWPASKMPKLPCDWVFES